MESFWDFHMHFLMDSTFQKNRLLDSSGKFDPTYTVTQNQYALLRNLSIKNGPAHDTTFIGYALTVAGGKVEEKVFDDGGAKASKRLFKRVKGKWYLEYYDNINWYPYKK